MSDYIRDSVLNALEKQLEQQRAAREQSRALEQGRINSSAESALREEYIRNEQAKRLLPQQTAMLGAGGFSETAALKLNSEYGEGRNDVNSARRNELSRLNSETEKGNAEDRAQFQGSVAAWEKEKAARQYEREQSQKELDFRREQLEYQKQNSLYQRELENKRFEMTREKELYDRRQKELLAAQKKARETAAAKAAAKAAAAKKQASIKKPSAIKPKEYELLGQLF